MEPSDNDEEPAEKKSRETKEQNNHTAIEEAEIEAEPASHEDNAAEFKTFKLKMWRYIAALEKYNNAKDGNDKEASILEKEPKFFKKVEDLRSFCLNNEITLNFTDEQIAELHEAVEQIRILAEKIYNRLIEVIQQTQKKQRHQSH